MNLITLTFFVCAFALFWIGIHTIVYPDYCVSNLGLPDNCGYSGNIFGGVVFLGIAYYYGKNLDPTINKKAIGENLKKGNAKEEN